MPLPPRAPFRIPHPRISHNTAFYLHIFLQPMLLQHQPALLQQPHPPHLTFRSPIALDSYHPNPNTREQCAEARLGRRRGRAVPDRGVSSFAPAGVLTGEPSWLPSAACTVHRSTVRRPSGRSAGCGGPGCAGACRTVVALPTSSVSVRAGDVPASGVRCPVSGVWCLVSGVWCLVCPASVHPALASAVSARR
jgi:hypothetical protein